MKRLLIHRLGSLGDTLLALPCFHLIRRTFPDAHIVVLTNAPVSAKAAPLEAVLRGSGLIDHVILHPVGLRDPNRLAQLRAEIESLSFDGVISLNEGRSRFISLRDSLFFRWCGLRKIIGLPVHRADLVCQPLPNQRDYESETVRLLRRLRTLGTIDPQDPAARDLGISELEISEAHRTLRDGRLPEKFIAASLGAKSLLKDWGDANWARFFAELSRERPALGLALIGSADEKVRADRLLQNWTGPRANLCGKTSVRVGVPLLSQAALFVGHDSGPAHLAAVAGRRCVVIHSAHAPPGQWFPLGPGHRNLYPYDFFDPAKLTDPAWQRRALDSISVEAVLAAVRDGLGTC